ncbi:hypothetical protein BE21_53580 [Sorangium cellulosum]|uniref:Uncharacterized protein n=1 Tax=Sorangium cellulosum TaxID=56 RepID=A0A150TEY1_SORCE|nr:hypothetical protein BE21_53580 [Sorangium cellulosum]
MPKWNCGTGSVPAGERRALRASHRVPIQSMQHSYVHHRHACRFEGELLLKPFGLTLMGFGPRQQFYGGRLTLLALDTDELGFKDDRPTSPRQVLPTSN